MNQELDFLEHNLDYLADISETTLKIRFPKDKRCVWKRKDYLKVMREGLEFWRSQPEHLQKRHLNGLKGFVLQALNNEFKKQRVQWLVGMMKLRPCDPKIDEEKRRVQEEVKVHNAKLLKEDPMHIDLKCAGCGLFLFRRDSKNNYKHKKEEVCTCDSSKLIQNKMKKRISDYRAERKKARQKKKRKGKK